MPANGKSKLTLFCLSPYYFTPFCAQHPCMNIYVNNKACELPEAAVIANALQVLSIPVQKGIALAVNSTVVPQQDWDTYTLNENDKVMIIKATQGG